MLCGSKESLRLAISQSVTEALEAAISKGLASSATATDEELRTLLAEAQNLKSLLARPNASCSRPACNKPSWNGEPNQWCSSACQRMMEFPQIALRPYGVLGSQLLRSKQVISRIAPPSASCAVVDPSALSSIKAAPSSAGGASRAVYNWLNILSEPCFPPDVVCQVTTQLRAKYHQYGSKHCVHVTGPNFKSQPCAEQEAVHQLSQAYLQVLVEFVGSGLSELRLAVISGGFQAGHFGGPQFPALTMAALQSAFSELSAEQLRHLSKPRSIELCIFAEAELAGFEAVFGPSALLVVSQPSMVPAKTFENSSYNHHYSVAAPCWDIPEFWAVAQEYLTSFYKLKGNVDLDAQQGATRFVAGLKNEVETVFPNQVLSAAATEALRVNLQTDVSWVCVRCWTCAQVDPVMQREWCGILQEGTRNDRPELFPALARIWKTMNLFCVGGRRKGAQKAVPWPMNDDLSTGEVKWTLFRGGRIPRDAVTWYEQAIRNRTVYRVPMAIATTKKGNFSLNHMIENSHPAEEPMVQWRFHLSPSERCMHANSLEPVTLLHGEDEFLLPPYSSFRPEKMEMLQHLGFPFYCIDVYIMPDNKAVAQNGPIPDFAAIAPWA